MATNFEAKSAQLAFPPSFVALAFRNKLEYRNADGHVNTEAMTHLHIVEIM